ncbi:MAG: ABC transporter substrate-binding protein [Chloroflexi bacterium]|nr:ABC transporter substrate-binding protein [Chloroflexota bacterium]
MSLTILEPFRSLHFAPHYVALALDLFAREGLSVGAPTASGLQVSIEMTLRGECDVWLGGPLTSYQLASQDNAARLIAFAEVAHRSHLTFLVGRQPSPNFGLRDLVGRTYIGVSEVPTIWVLFKWLLAQEGIDPCSFERISGLSFVEQVAEFRRGRGDYADLPQPFVEELVSEGVGHVVYSAGDAIGPIAFTAYLSVPTTIDAKRDDLEAVVRAIDVAQRWLAEHNGSEVARLIGSYFPKIPQTRLAAIVDRYQRHQTWPTNPRPQLEHWERMHQILRATRFIDHDVPLDQVVTTTLTAPDDAIWTAETRRQRQPSSGSVPRIGSIQSA